ncbi:MAG: GTPase, partial [Myxococcaceae bacterium]
MNGLPEAGEVRELIELFEPLPSVRHQRERLSRLLADYQRGLSEDRQALTAALIGATGAGKSTLLNALAGSRIAVEGVDRPTSRSLVVYAPLDAQLSTLERLGGRVERYSPQRSANSWSGQVFLDTPDLNSVELQNRQVARAGLEQADVAIVVLHRGSVAEATQLDFLSEFARRRRVIFVLNFADELGATAREDLKAQVRKIAEDHFKLSPEVFAVSALNARRGDGELFEYPALLAALRELGEKTTVERVRASNAVAALREISQVLLDAEDELATVTDEAAKELQTGFEVARERLTEDFAARLQSAQPHLSQQVRAQAAGRWWGPAALWMRLSTVGAGGFGAAALVARQSLPIGLAVAAASAAVNAVQDKTRAKSAESVVVGGAAAEENSAVGQLARAALASARQRAISAGLEPEQLGLPPSAAMLEALMALRVASFAFAQTDAITQSV